MKRVRALAASAILLAGSGARAWHALPPENLLVIDTSAGRIVVAMRPDIAPLAVARVKTLARAGVYDGLLFHRVIAGFVDQTGNPNNHDGGVSTLPDLAPEFRFPLAPEKADTTVRHASDEQCGFLGPVPFCGVPNPGDARKLNAAGAYCAGVAGMGRQADPHSANSEIFFMRAPSRRLDGQYTVWGRVVAGLDTVRRIQIGEPPVHPDRMLHVRVASDMPADTRPALQIMDANTQEFTALVQHEREKKGADFSVCDIDVPVRDVTRAR